MKNNIFLHPLLPSAWDAITVTVCCAAILLLEALFSAGGGFHVETVGYIPHYLILAGKPLGAIIFDPVSTDLGNYQARELSYLVDLWDVRFLAWSAKLGAVHFYSFSQWFLMVLTVLVQQYGTRKLFPQLPGYFATLFSLAFVLLPCVSANMYFRSAKHGTAFLFTIIVYLTIYLFRKTCIKNAPGAFAGLAAALVLAPLFDRQALFFVSLYTVGTGLLLSVQKKFSLPVQPLTAAGIAGICACLFAALYNLFIAPALIQYWNGYTPSFAMQNMPPAFQPETILNGAEFLFANLGYLLNRGNGFAALSVGIIFAILTLSGAVASAQKTGEMAVSAHRSPHRRSMPCLFHRNVCETSGDSGNKDLLFSADVRPAFPVLRLSRGFSARVSMENQSGAHPAGADDRAPPLFLCGHLPCHCGRRGEPPAQPASSRIPGSGKRPGVRLPAVNHAGSNGAHSRIPAQAEKR